MSQLSQLLDQLNAQQLPAVVHAGGPAMVMAGAGSGKTRVLTTRAAWLMADQHVDPTGIVLVTFTNKAAQEMNKRVAEMTGHILPFSGTFHRLSARILRKDGAAVGLSPNFTIYDSDDQLSLIKSIYKTHGFNPKEFNPKAVKAAISKAKNELISWGDFAQVAEGHFQEFAARVYKLYQLELQKQQAVDFDDLLLSTVQLLQQEPRILEKYQQQFSHVLVDEYQDTNRVQYQLTKLLSEPQRNVYVVGDFAQSIYAWRGANYRNMMKLKKEYPDLKEYKLEQNYRSTQTILDAATQVISQTTAHPILALWTENSNTDKITLFENSTGEDEAQAVVNEIKRLSSPYNYQDIVILYRTNAQSRPFEEALIRAGIPYQLVGGFKFYERKEIKDVLAHLRLLLNPQDSVSWERIKKLGKRKATHFLSWVEQKRRASQPTENTETTPLSQTSPLELLQEILTISTFREQFDKDDPEDVSRLENIDELLNVASQFTDSVNLLENISLVQDEYMADLAPEQTRQMVTLMSLHSAKGLEYPVVFIVGLEEGLLPHSRSLLDKEQMEEERRLCYVGITRAKEKLYISYARRRWTYGTSEYSLRSRFLGDINPSLIHQAISSAEPSYSGYAGRGSYFGGRTEGRPTSPPPKPGGRKLVLDDSTLEAVLHGDMDIEAFLDS